MPNLLKLVGAALALVLIFSLSAVFIAVAAVLGLLLWAWFWWQTRHVRRQMREQMAAMQAAMRQAGEGASYGAADRQPDSASPTGRGRVFDGKVVRDEVSPAAGQLPEALPPRSGQS